ncbi:hypothetical protein IH86_23360 [Sphingobium yanoikuyae]|nr:hypothetical protein IH86_23360 [Sphingobium yanoikuyae]
MFAAIWIVRITANCRYSRRNLRSDVVLFIGHHQPLERRHIFDYLCCARLFANRLAKPESRIQKTLAERSIQPWIDRRF